MAKDITKVICSLRNSAINRCRDRLEEAALKARDLISKGNDDDEKGLPKDKPQYGVTSILKRRHGL